MKKNITIELTNNQALHLWSILVNSITETSRDLKTRKVFKQDGTRNLAKKYLSDYEQEQLDSIRVAELVYKHIEDSADFSEIEEQQ